MKFSESWLRTLVDPSLSSEELCHLLTMAGLEVEERTPAAPTFDKVVVAEVLSKEKHPDADRLNVLSVNVGQAEPLTIVCGAQNVIVGMKAPCALVGAKLPEISIKQAKVRGVASFGMMCSETEMGLAEQSDGLMVLAADAVVGQDIRQHLDLDDHLITLKLTPNRSDCLSLRGIAREVAALTGAVQHDVPQARIETTTQKTPEVTVSAQDACPRYSVRVIRGVDAKAKTPDWMQKRLERCGLRSISALVDVTNYVLLELGQPLHAFDLNKLSGDIEVRFAQAGEQIKLLNDQTVSLDPDMLVIADAAGPAALAGVMGGADSAVSDATTDILLESAFFVPSVIVGKTRRLGVTSDSAYRFERGVDFQLAPLAMARASQLILEICGGQAGEVVERVATLPQRQPVRLRPARAHRVLGIELDAKQISEILTRLGMAVSVTEDALRVTPPSYRFDISIEEDLIEEVARVYGYENIPSVPTQARMSILPQQESQRSLSKVRQVMVGREYQEAINYAFVDRTWERDLCGNTKAIELQNPIASQMAVMRSSLLGGLVAALQSNLSRKHTRVRLFEIGGCFAATNDSYTQKERLAAIAYGSAQPEQWGESERPVDFYDIKGDLEALFAPRNLTFKAEVHAASHPGRSAAILLEGMQIGWIGELHPQWQQRFDFPRAPVWFEVDLSALQQVNGVQVTDISRFPAVRRDLAVVVDEKIQVQTLIEAMQSASAPFVIDIGLFDVYRGKGVEEGKKSLAFRVLLQDTRKTLTDVEIDQDMARLKDVLQKQGAQLRV